MSDIASDLAQVNVIRSFNLKFMVPENVKYKFSVNEAILGIFMNSCMWATVHLHEDRGTVDAAVRREWASGVPSIFDGYAHLYWICVVCGWSLEKRHFGRRH